MQSLEERFWPRVAITGPDDCWNWQRGCGKNGYGQIRPAPKAAPQGAHRVAFALTYGDPGLLWVLHKCDNRKCCNPAHLFLGTAGDNVADMIAKGRAKPGGGGGGCGEDPATLRERVRRMTDDDIRLARHMRAQGATYRTIGQRIGVCHTTILSLIRGKSWQGYEV